MNWVKRLKPRTTIYSAVLVLAALLVWVSGWSAWEAQRNFRAARQAQAAAEAGRLIQRAGHYYAQERGFTAALLAAASPPPPTLLAKVQALHKQADEPLDQAVHKLRALQLAGAGSALLAQALQAAETMHAELHAARGDGVAPGGGTAAALTVRRWIETATLHIQRLRQLRDALSGALGGAPHAARELWTLDTWLGELADYAGRERALLAAAIAAGRPLVADDLAALAGYRQTVGLHLQQLARIAADRRTDPAVAEPLRRIGSDFAGGFQEVRSSVLQAAATGRYPMGAESWLNLSTAAIDTIVEASWAAGDRIADALAARVRYRQLQQLLGVTGVLAAPLLTLLGFAGTASGTRRLEAARERAERHLHRARRAGAARRRAEAALRNLVDRNPIGTLVIDGERRVLFVNPAARTMLGADLERLQAEPPHLPLLAGARTEWPILRPGRSSGTAEITVSDTRWEASDALLVMLRDITETKLAEQALQHVRRHDPLTGLPNLTLFLDRLEQALMRARRYGRALRVVVVDLDRFRFINETLGHAVGDSLLRTSAEQLRAAVRETDTVARIGSDQFALLLENLSEDAAASVLAKIAGSFLGAFQLLDQEVRCSASIGHSGFPQDSRDAETLLRYADIALQSAKRAGGGAVSAFSTEQHASAASRPQLQQALAAAIGNAELSLHYQPRIDLRSGQVLGMEALLRWQHPELGWVSPAEFIPIAEESGLIVAIGEWVLHTACTQTRAWRQAGLPPVTVSVNLSALQLAQSDIVDTVARVLRDTGLAADALELEITETALIHSAESAADKITRLRELGVRCSIDDFGTGYSSLSYLRQLPIHALKVDRSFVHKVAQDPGNAAIATAVISLARDLGLRVVAEGVESEEDAAYLRQRGCDEVQGYYFARPLPAVEFAAHLAQPPAFTLAEASADQAHRTVLILDDDPNIVSALNRLLRSDGYHILTASEPDQAFRLLALRRTGLIISDLRMPAMSGIEFLKRCRKLHPHAARMILSGAADREAVMATINEVGVERFLSKPWDEALLREAVRAALSKVVPSAA